MTTATTTVPKQRKTRTWPDTVAGLGLFLTCAVVLALTYWQFRGNFTPKAQLTMLADRAGLVMDRGSKVTFNGVSIGRVADISEVDYDGKPTAKLTLDVDPRYVQLIPVNVIAKIAATTVFGNKYVSFTSPKQPSQQRITPQHVINAVSVTTEFNTLFETLVHIAEHVDPVKVNLTLSAAAQALSGLGDKFGASVVNGNTILDDVNARMPTIRHDIAQLAALGDIYADNAANMFNALDNAVITARTLNRQQADIDAALLAATGFGRTGEDIFTRSKPYLERVVADLVPTSRLLDTYSPEVLCTFRNFAELVPKIGELESGNAYSARLGVSITGAENPYVYPENLPRVNARGGPGGAPGCWAKITQNLWPAPYLVMDTGNSIAPYNHFELSQPLASEYIWGRQYGEYTINP
ncbi:Mce-family protein Mce1A [Mycobacterium tuberculosis H37Rv] [Mycobacterium shimoidei]|uniref:Mce-family protein Mce1A [Mycobacterium tuberculosis H37Rv] n=1 Tax=Mycobacterium shimoidei TaxID=29313 RepID=A0A375YXQ0_MYCSH|nr:MCE family protein [Mycobacterium shimoidei]SRX93646.1 Mce-family protein Mce1A [Mycobacterium tuberculosis H37Rv] [Mycobacterium shimoidei]